MALAEFWSDLFRDPVNVTFHQSHYRCGTSLVFIVGYGNLTT